MAEKWRREKRYANKSVIPKWAACGENVSDPRVVTVVDPNVPADIVENQKVFHEEQHSITGRRWVCCLCLLLCVYLWLLLSSV